MSLPLVKNMLLTIFEIEKMQKLPIKVEVGTLQVVIGFNIALRVSKYGVYSNFWGCLNHKLTLNFFQRYLNSPQKYNL